MILLYPENESHREALDKISKSYDYAGIIHDKDTWTEDDGYNLAKDYFIDYSNEITNRDNEHEYFSTKVNGYTFIVLASEDDRTSMFMSDEQIEWLSDEMEKASKDGLPIFVVSHWPINQTHGLPETWGDEDMEPDDGGIGDQSAAVEEILK